MLPVARFRFSLEIQEPVAMPAYAGSALRGLLGHGLRRIACVTRQPTCDGCMLRYNCLYSTFFESPGVPGQTAARYKALPHPFVLEPEVSPEREIPEGGLLRLNITLIGEAVEQVPYLIHALDLAGRRGLGRGGGRFIVAMLEREQRLGKEDWESVYEADPGEYRRLEPLRLPLPEPPNDMRIRLLTPLRLKRHGRFVGPSQLTATDLLLHLCKRLAMLADLYRGDPNPFDWNTLFRHAEDMRIAGPQLHWHDWTRFSSRQNTLMQMGGLLGGFRLEGETLASFWPALWFGQWVHVGKGTSFGLGGYRIETRQACQV